MNASIIELERGGREPFQLKLKIGCWMDRLNEWKRSIIGLLLPTYYSSNSRTRCQRKKDAEKAVAAAAAAAMDYNRAGN